MFVDTWNMQKIILNAGNMSEILKKCIVPVHNTDFLLRKAEIKWVLLYNVIQSHKIAPI